MRIYQQCVYEKSWFDIYRNNFEFRVYQSWRGFRAYKVVICCGRYLWTGWFPSVEDAKIRLREILGKWDKLEEMKKGARLICAHAPTWQNRSGKKRPRLLERVCREVKLHACQ